MQQLYTKAGRELVGVPWQRYPRPQLVREDWLCLNGEWELGFEGKTMPIRVPFCPESLLSGVETPPKPGTELRFRRFFSVPEAWRGRRVLLHFGAVMRRAVVLVNGLELARHDNGYLPFSVDVTEALRPGKNELLVLALNDLDPRFPWGKQRLDRGGMWYTPCSGIWQTVWLEPVPECYIRRLRIQVGLDWAEIAVEGPESGFVRFNGRDYPLEKGKVRLRVEEPELWSPERPRLYPFSVRCGQDRAESYFALRTLSIMMADGLPRLCLNGKPYFFHGLLDQGYWSDGLYTPATPTGYARDIMAMKRLGFNTLRKHIKIEPEQFYYDCDRLGMIVFQDMVNNGGYNYLEETALPNLGFVRRRDRNRNRDPEARENFCLAMDETVDLLYNHPCICLWTIFNEGWGQFNADAAYYRLRARDKSRFIDATSGWFHQSASDVDSQHHYLHKLRLGTESKPQLLSEFGGYCWKLPEHSFNLEKTYGYRQCPDRESFVRDLRALYEQEVLPLVSRGLCGSIYTQVSDVEDETNGLMTFDRAVEKLRPEDLADLAPRLQAALKLP